MSYVFDWTTVESLNPVFRQARQAEDRAVQEDYLHRNKREGAVRMIEREREPKGAGTVQVKEAALKQPQAVVNASPVRLARRAVSSLSL